MNARIKKQARRFSDWGGIVFINDMRGSTRVEVRTRIDEQARFSLSYASLLAVSTIICTLGLVLNAAPIVIGGMLISPLMWPILKLSISIVEDNRKHVRQALILLALSVLIGVASASIITLLSPVKTLTDEILARTNPTLLDIFVAMAGGIVATLSVLKEKVSSSLAGVAIATALMPPLCVAGIGLTLHNFEIAGNAAGLVGANIVSILFVSIFIFLIADFDRKRRASQEFRKRSIVIVSLMLLLIALPLGYSLYEYTFQSSAYSRSRAIILGSLEELSPHVELSQLEIQLRRRNVLGRSVEINANVVLPEEISFTYEDQQRLIEALRSNLEQEIDLKLTIQKSIAIISEENTQNNRIQNDISSGLIEALRQQDSSLVIQTLATTQNTLGQGDVTTEWVVSATVLADPDVKITNEDLDEIQASLSQTVGKPIDLNLSIIPRLTLQSQPQIELDGSKQAVQQFFAKRYPSVDVRDISISTNSQGKATFLIDLHIPKDFEIKSSDLAPLKSLLKTQTKTDVTLHLNITEKVELRL